MEQQTKKQTAVEWLIEQFEKGIQYNPLEKDGYSNAHNKLIEQAKEIESNLIKQLETKIEDLTAENEQYERELNELTTKNK